MIDYRYEERRGRKGRLNVYHEHQVTYAGHKSWVNLDKEYKLGTEFYVISSRINPDNIELTEEKLTFYELYQRKVGILGTLMILGIVTYFTYPSLDFFKQAIESSESMKARLPKQVKTNEKEMHDVRRRLERPLRYAIPISLIAFCGLLYLGFNESEFPSLVTLASIVSLVLFFIVVYGKLPWS